MYIVDPAAGHRRRPDLRRPTGIRRLALAGLLGSGLGVALVAMPAHPASAGPAATVISVNSTSVTSDSNGCAPGTTCTLPDAINQANQTSGPVVIRIPATTISFGSDGTTLPPINNPSVAVQGAGPGTVIQWSPVPGVGGVSYVFTFAGTGAGTTAKVTDLTVEGAGLYTSAYSNFDVERVQVLNPVSYGIDTNAGTVTIDSTTVNGAAGDATTSGPRATALGIEIAGFSTNASITNTTVNSMASGIASLGNDLTLVNDTVTGSWGDGGVGHYMGFGLDNYATGTVTVRNTVLAHNANTDCDAVGDNPFTYADHNVTDDMSCGFTDSSNVVTTDAKLAPLADNGGPVMTEALLPGSPAIGADQTAI